MSPQELRALQEDYSQVYELVDEGYEKLPVDKMMAQSKRLSKKPKAPGEPRWGPNDEAASRIRKVAGSTHSPSKAKKTEQENRAKGLQTEQVDLYDIIFSHLLDEGYADTEQAAEAIMVNMSEDWRQSIVEEVLDERNRGEEGMSDREVSRRRNLGGNTRSKVSSSSLGDHGPQGAIQKFHNVKSKQRQAIHKTARGVRGDTGESGGKGRYEANKDHKDGYPSITKRGQGPS